MTADFPASRTEKSVRMLSLGERVRRVKDGSEGVVHGADLDGKVRVQLSDGSFCSWQKASNFASLDGDAGGTTAPISVKTLSRAPGGGSSADSMAIRAVLDSVDADDHARESALNSLVLKGKGAAAKMRAASTADPALAPSVARHLKPETACGWQVRLAALRVLKGCGPDAAAAHVTEIIAAIEYVASVPDKPTRLRDAYQSEVEGALKAAGAAVAPFIHPLIERVCSKSPRMASAVTGTHVKGGRFDAEAYRKASEQRMAAFKQALALRSLAMFALEACAPHASEAHALAVAAKLSHADKDVRQQGACMGVQPAPPALRESPPLDPGCSLC